jgi:hypothetical protein
MLKNITFHATQLKEKLVSKVTKYVPRKRDKTYFTIPYTVALV